jgi:hypothetical protein
VEIATEGAIFKISEEANSIIPIGTIISTIAITITEEIEAEATTEVATIEATTTTQRIVITTITTMATIPEAKTATIIIITIVIEETYE